MITHTSGSTFPIFLFLTIRKLSKNTIDVRKFLTTGNVIARQYRSRCSTFNKNYIISQRMIILGAYLSAIFEMLSGLDYRKYRYIIAEIKSFFVGYSLVSYKRFIKKDVRFLQLCNNYLFSDLFIWNCKYLGKPLHHKDIQRVRSKFQKIFYNAIKVFMKSLTKWQIQTT